MYLVLWKVISTHLLFIDSDIDFDSNLFLKWLQIKMLYLFLIHLKTLNWDQAWERIKSGKIKNEHDLQYKALYTIPDETTK